MKDYDLEVKNIFNEIQKKNQTNYQLNRNKIYEKYPDIKEYDIKLIEKKIEKIKYHINNDFEKEKKTDEEINDIKNNLEIILNRHSIEKDALKIKYDCNICKDTGYVDGKKCKCYINKQIQLVKEDLNLYDEKEATFENIDLKYYNQNINIAGKTYMEYMKIQIADLQEMILNYKKNKKPINAVIMGPTGTGKSFLSKCIANEFIKREKTVLYVGVDELISSTFKNDDILSFAKNCELLVLDNLGKENISDYSLKLIFNLTDCRLYDKKSTVIATSHDYTELSKFYEDGLSSRLYNYYYTIKLMGLDLRRIRNV